MNNMFIMATNEEKKYTLIARLDENNKPVKCCPYVVAWLFDPETQTWAQGHYFEDVREAVAYLFGNTKPESMVY